MCTLFRILLLHADVGRVGTGADLLASQGFRVVMPDIVKGKIMTPEMFAPTDELVSQLINPLLVVLYLISPKRARKQKVAYFSEFPGLVTSQSKPVAEIVEAIKSSGHSKLGALGMCWGYKVVITSEGAGEFLAIASAHPSQVCFLLTGWTYMLRESLP